MNLSDKYCMKNWWIRSLFIRAAVSYVCGFFHHFFPFVWCLLVTFTLALSLELVFKERYNQNPILVENTL